MHLHYTCSHYDFCALQNNFDIIATLKIKKKIVLSLPNFQVLVLNCRFLSGNAFALYFSGVF